MDMDYCDFYNLQIQTETAVNLYKYPGYWNLNKTASISRKMPNSIKIPKTYFTNKQRISFPANLQLH